MIAEEMRVLYVALTRAEEKLILTATVPDFEKQVRIGYKLQKKKRLFYLHPQELKRNVIWIG